MSNQKWTRIHWTCNRTVVVVSRSPVQCDSAMSRVSDFEHDRRIWTIWAGQQHTYLFSPPFKLVRKWKRESTVLPGTAVILPHKVRVPLASAMSILVMTWQVYTPSSLGSTLEIIRSGPSKVYLWKRQKKKKSHRLWTRWPYESFPKNWLETIILGFIFFCFHPSNY